MQSIIGLAQKPQPICDAHVQDDALSAVLKVPSILQTFTILSIQWRLPLYFQFYVSTGLYVNDKWYVTRDWKTSRIVFKHLDPKPPVETVLERATASFFFEGLYQALLPSNAVSAKTLATELANKLDIHIGRF